MKIRKASTLALRIFSFQLFLAWCEALFPPFNALSQQVFDLPVEGAEIVLRPRAEFFIQRVGDAKRHLLFLIVRLAHGA